MATQWSLFTRSLRPQAQLRVKLQRKMQDLDRTLNATDLDAKDVHLKVTLAKQIKSVRASLALTTPFGVFRSADADPDPMTAFDRALRLLMEGFSTLRCDRRPRPEQAALAVPLPPPIHTSNPAFVQALTQAE